MAEIIFTKLYERWKRTDLLAVAFETMPKKDKNKAQEALRKLHSKHTEDLSD